MLSTQSELDLKSTFLAPYCWNPMTLLHTLIQINWPSIVSPLGDSEGLMRGSRFIARQSFRLQEFGDAFCFMLDISGSATGVHSVFLYIHVQTYQPSLHVGWCSNRCIAPRTTVSTCSVLHQHESLCIDLSSLNVFVSVECLKKCSQEENSQKY